MNEEQGFNNVIKLIKSFKSPWHPLHQEMMLQCIMCLLQLLVYWKSQIFIAFCSYLIWCITSKQISALIACFYWSFFKTKHLFKPDVILHIHTSINGINENFLTRPFRNKVYCDVYLISIFLINKYWAT